MDQLLERTVVDWTDCPLVEINPRKVSGIPVLRGTRMPADAILQNYASGSSVQEIAVNFEIPEESVRALLSYAIGHRLDAKR